MADAAGPADRYPGRQQERGDHQRQPPLKGRFAGIQQHPLCGHVQASRPVGMQCIQRAAGVVEIWQCSGRTDSRSGTTKQFVERLAYRLTVPERFTETFAAGLASYGDRPCVEFEGRWYSGNEVTAYGEAIAAVLRVGGVADGAPVGLVVRNRLPHAAAIIGFLADGRPVSMIYSFQSPESIGRDIEKLELSAIVADREDWTAPVVDAAKRTGSAGVAISLQAPLVAAIEGLERRDIFRRHA